MVSFVAFGQQVDQLKVENGKALHFRFAILPGLQNAATISPFTF
jgi:hypothetical protein